MPADNPSSTAAPSEAVAAIDPAEQPLAQVSDEPDQPTAVSMPPRPLMVYDEGSEAPSSVRADHLLQDQRAKFEARAQRFGCQPPRRVNEAKVLGAKRALLREGFQTGFDPYADEFAQRREMRKKRFGEVMNDKNEDGGVERPMISGRCLEDRRDVGQGDVIRGEALHLFGVDCLRSRDIMTHFKDWGPSWVEWINDSSCNVVFEDAFSAGRALRAVGVEQVEDWGGEGGFKWLKGRAVKKGDGIVPVWVRMAGRGDVRPERPNPDSRWSRTGGGMREQRRRSREGERREGQAEIMKREERARRFKSDIELGGNLVVGPEEMKRRVERRNRFGEAEGNGMYVGDEERRRREEKFGLSLEKEEEVSEEEKKKRAERSKRFGKREDELDDARVYLGVNGGIQKARLKRRSAANLDRALSSS